MGGRERGEREKVREREKTGQMLRNTEMILSKRTPKRTRKTRCETQQKLKAESEGKFSPLPYMPLGTTKLPDFICNFLTNTSMYIKQVKPKCLTCFQRILNAQHGWPVTIFHLLWNLFLGKVSSIIFYANCSLKIIEVPSIQLKEFNQQDTKIWVWFSCIFTRMELE